MEFVEGEDLGEKLQHAGGPLPLGDLAASHMAAVVDVMVGRTIHAAKAFNAAEILVAGCVSVNGALRTMIQALSKFSVHIPPLALSTDNATMIASAGHYRFTAGQRGSWASRWCPTGR